MFLLTLLHFYTVLVEVQRLLYETARTFGRSKHSRIFLIGPELELWCNVIDCSLGSGRGRCNHKVGSEMS